MSKIKVAIAGATGYTGSELLRILLNHHSIEITAISSESHTGKYIEEVHTFLAGTKMELTNTEGLVNSNPDIVFLGFPHGVSMDFVKKYSDKGFKIIDLSGDFRFSDAASYKEWYGQDHLEPEKVKQSVFGLPELYREDIRKANLIGNPGCYPTSVILPMYPLLQEGIIEPSSIIADSKSGVTGAGIKPSPITHYPNVSENFKAYGLLSHRHTGEIQEILSTSSNKKCEVLFTPHLLPVNRGILTTCYSSPQKAIDNETLQSIYRKYYEKEPFVRLRESAPAVQDVRGSNFCDIYAVSDKRTGRILTISAIDNLVKGAAGQAVQNMNLMFGINEKEGLTTIPLSP